MQKGSDAADRAHGAQQSGPRLLILGDSWIHGLVAEQDRTFGKLLARRLAAGPVLDLSEISRTALDTAGLAEEIERFRPTVAIVNVGGTDALVLPRPTFQRLIDRYAPPDWQGLTGLSPRVRFSSRLLRRARQLVEQQAKIALKRLLIRLFGGRSRRPAEETERAIQLIMSTLGGLGTFVICVGFAGADERLHPRSQAGLYRTNAMLEKAASVHPRAIYVATDSARRWDDFFADRLHLNPGGHERVAQLVVERLIEAGDAWRELLPEGRRAAATAEDPVTEAVAGVARA